MEIITSNNFEAATASGVVLVDFFANWCGPCKMMAPVLEEIAGEMNDIKIYKVDVDNDQSLASKYGIQAIPNLIIFKDGKAVDQITGFTAKGELVKRLEAQL